MNSTPIYLAVLSPVVSLCVAAWGFRRTTRADRLKMFLDLQERYLAPSARTGRRLVHRRLAKLTADTFGELTEDERDDLHHALAVMETIAIACESGHIDQAMILNGMGRSYSSAMRKSQPYIEYQARVRGFRLYQHAARLGSELNRILQS